MQVKLDRKLFMVDSPGVVFPGEDMSPVDMVLKNVASIHHFRDYQAAAKEIFNRCDPVKVSSQATLLVKRTIYSCYEYCMLIIGGQREKKLTVEPIGMNHCMMWAVVIKIYLIDHRLLYKWNMHRKSPSSQRTPTP